MLLFSKSQDKESLVGNIVLPPELFDSDSEVNNYNVIILP